ncbi:MAG: metallophosphoesterase [Trueperaceae bacterium]
MRLAVLADVHGNLAAFEAALEAARRSEPDLLVVAGDVVNGAPDSRACWDLARAHADVLLRGNHERYVFDRGTAQGDPAWLGPRFRPLDWTAREMAGLEPELRATPIAARPVDGVLVVHAVPDDDATPLFAWSTDAEVEGAFAGHAADLIVRGHNHLPFRRPLADGRELVSLGAVGLSLVGRPDAQWGLFTRRANGSWHVAHRSERYDVAATVRRFRETGYLDVAGRSGSCSCARPPPAPTTWCRSSASSGRGAASSRRSWMKTRPSRRRWTRSSDGSDAVARGPRDPAP